MAISTIPAASAGKTRYVVTLLSGTSWTVPTGCTYVNATLIGGGGGSNTGIQDAVGSQSLGGEIIVSNVATTPGASITYAIGAGGAASGAQGGTTTFVGATSAVGGFGLTAVGQVGTRGLSAVNGASWGNSTQAGAVGGQGKIELEYWV